MVFFRNFSEEILKIQSIKLRLFIVLWQIFHNWIVILLNYWGYPWIYAICQGLFSIPSTVPASYNLAIPHFHIIDPLSHIVLLFCVVWEVFQNVSLSMLLLGKPTQLSCINTDPNFSHTKREPQTNQWRRKNQTLTFEFFSPFQCREDLMKRQFS